MKRSETLRNQLNELKTEIDALEQTADTPEDLTRCNTLIEDFESKQKLYELARQIEEKAELVRAASFEAPEPQAQLPGAGEVIDSGDDRGSLARMRGYK